jgi:hypothetical protein
LYINSVLWISRYRQALQNTSPVDVLLVECPLVFLYPNFTERTYLSLQSIVVNVYKGKIDNNAPKTQHDIFNKMMCMHTAHVTAHNTNYMLTTRLIVWWSGCNVSSILQQNMRVCYLFRVSLCFSYTLGNWLGVLGWQCTAS